MASGNRTDLNSISRELDEVAERIDILTRKTNNLDATSNVKKQTKEVLKLTNEIVRNSKVAQEAIAELKKEMISDYNEIMENYTNGNKSNKISTVNRFLENFRVISDKDIGLREKPDKKMKELYLALTKSKKKSSSFEDEINIRKAHTTENLTQIKLTNNPNNYSHSTSLHSESQLKSAVITKLNEIYKDALKDLAKEFTLDKGELDDSIWLNIYGFDAKKAYRDRNSIVSKSIKEASAFERTTDDSIKISENLEKTLLKFAQTVKQTAGAYEVVNDMCVELGAILDENDNTFGIRTGEKGSASGKGASVYFSKVPGFNTGKNYGSIHSHYKNIDGINEGRPSLDDIKTSLTNGVLRSFIYYLDKYIVIDFSDLQLDSENIPDNYNRELDVVAKTLQGYLNYLMKQIRSAVDYVSLYAGNSATLTKPTLGKDKVEISVDNDFRNFQNDTDFHNVIVELYNRALADIISKVGGKMYELEIVDGKLSEPKVIPPLSLSQEALLELMKTAKHEMVSKQTSRNIDVLSNTFRKNFDALTKITAQQDAISDGIDVEIEKQQKYNRELNHTNEELELMRSYLKEIGNDKINPFSSMSSFEIPKDFIQNMNGEIFDGLKISANDAGLYSLATFKTKDMNLFLSWCIDAAGGIENVRQMYDALKDQHEEFITNALYSSHRFDTTIEDTNTELVELNDSFEKIDDSVNVVLDNSKEKAAYIYFYLRQVKGMIDSIYNVGSDVSLPWGDEVLPNKNTFNFIEKLLSINEDDLIAWGALQKGDLDGIADFIYGIKHAVENIEYAKSQIKELSESMEDVYDDIHAYDHNIYSEISSLVDYATWAIDNYYNPLRIAIDTLIDKSDELNEHWFNPFETYNNTYIEDLIKSGESAGDVLERIKEEYGYNDDSWYDDAFEPAEMIDNSTQAVATLEDAISLEERLAVAVRNARIEQENYAEAIPVAYNAGLNAIREYSEQSNYYMELLRKILIKTTEQYDVLEQAIRELSDVNSTTSLIEDQSRLSDSIISTEAVINRFNEVLREMADISFYSSMVNPIKQFANQWLLVANDIDVAAEAQRRFQRVSGDVVDDWKSKSPIFNVNSSTVDDTISDSTNKANKSEKDLSKSNTETAKSLDKETKAAEKTAKSMDSLANNKKKAKKANEDLNKSAKETAKEGLTEETKKTEETSEAISETLKIYKQFEKNIDKAQGIISKDNGRNTEKYISTLISGLQDAQEMFDNIDKNNISDDTLRRMEEFIELVNASSDKQNLSGTYLNLEAYKAKISQVLNINTKMSEALRSQFRDLYDEINNVINTQEVSGNQINEIKRRFLSLNTIMQQTHQTGSSFFSRLSASILNANVQFIRMYASWYDWIRYARYAINTVVELDSALVDLRKTTSMSNAQINEFYYNSNELAKSLGVTTQQIIEQAAEWSRLGYSSKEAATQMAEMSSQFASISPGMDTDTSTSGLISIMKAFDVDVLDAERQILDNINTIGNNFGTSNEQIITGLEKSSAAMRSANNSLEETIALFTAGQEILQDADTMGTALKTISLRIRGYDEETLELSDEFENLSGVIANLTKTASTPGGISLFADDSKETYKSTYEILKEISDIWDELTDKQQAQLLQKLFGKNRAQAGAAILTNFETAKESIIAMTQAAGSADKEMEIIQESLDYKLNKLKETWVGFAQDLIDRGVLGKLIDGLTALSDILIKISKIPLSGVLAFFVSANLTSILSKITGANSLMSEFSKFKSDLNNSTSFASAAEFAEAYRTSYSPIIIDAVTNTNSLSEAQKSLEKTIEELAKGKINALKSSLKSLGKSLAISAAVTAAIVVIEKLATASETLRSKLSSLYSTYADEVNTINEYKQQIKTQKAILNDNTVSIQKQVDARQKLLDIQSELINQYKDEPDKIKVITNAIGLYNNSASDLVDTLDTLTSMSFQSMFDDFNNNSSIDGWFQQAINVFSGYSNNFDKVLDDMYISDVEFIDKYFEDYGKAFDATNEKLFAYAKTLSTLNYETGAKYFAFSGNTKDVYNDLVKLSQFAKNNNLDKEYEGLSKITAELYGIVKAESDVYDQWVLYENILSESGKGKGYSSIYKNIIDLKSDYDKAIINGEDATTIMDNLATAIQSGIAMGLANGDDEVATYFKQLYPEVQSYIKKLKFNEAFNSDAYEYIKTLIGYFKERGYTVEDLISENISSSSMERDYLSKIKQFGLTYFDSMTEFWNYIHDEYSLLYNDTEHLLYKYLNDKTILSFVSQDDLKILAQYDDAIKILEKNLQLYADKNQAVSMSILEIENLQKKSGITIEEQISKISNLTDGMDKLKDIYNSVQNGKFDFTLINKKDFKESFQMMDGYAEFIDVISNNSSNIKACEDAFNNLVTSYINYSGVLKTVTKDTASVTEAMLTNMGVVNAHELVQSQLIDSYDGLRKAMNKLRISGDNIADLTANDIKALSQEVNWLDYASESLSKYVLKTYYAKNADLSSIENINYLIKLSEQAGIASTHLLNLANVMELMSTIQERIATGSSTDADKKLLDNLQKRADSLRTQIKDDLVKVSYDPDSDYTAPKDSSSSSNSDKDFDWIKVKIERLESEISKLDEVASSAFTSYEEKLDSLAKKHDLLTQKIELQTLAAEKYKELTEEVDLDEQYKQLVREGGLDISTITDSDLKDQIERYQERWEAYLEVIANLRQTQQDKLETTVSEYETSLGEFDRLRDNGLISEKQYIAELKNLYNTYYKGKEGLEQQYRDAVINTLNIEKSYLESVASAAASVIQKQIDDLEKQRDAQIEPLEDQIKLLEKAKEPLQDQLDDMEKQREAREEQLAVEQALYNLRRAENQREKLTYTSGQGMVYKSDDKAIKDARDALDDAEYDVAKRKLQDQIDALDDQIDQINKQVDAINENYDKQIKALEKIKNAWQEAIDDITNAQNIALLKEYFGDEGAITKLLSGEYNPGTGWTKDYIQNLKDLSAINGKGISNTATELAALYGLKATDFVSEFDTVISKIDEEEKKALAATDAIRIGAEQQSEAITTIVLPAISQEIDYMNAFNDVAGQDISKTVTINYQTNGYSSDLPEVGGTGIAAAKGFNNDLIGEKGREIWVHTQDGTYDIVDKPTMVDLKPDDVVLNNAQTEEVLKRKKGRAFANGNAIFTPLEDADPERYNMLNKITNTLVGTNGLASMIKNINSTLKDVLVTGVGAGQSPTISFGDINVSCTGVTSQEVVQTISDTLEKSFSGLALNAYQRSKASK